MKRTPVLFGLATALALAACSKEPAAPAPEEDGASATPAAPVASPAVQDTAIPTETVATPTPTPSAEAATTATEIPQAIRGRWGLVPADCTSKLGDAKGLLTISAGQLKFYESVAKVGRIKEADESRLRATFNYSGEGQTWTQDVVLALEGGGKTLVRRDYGPDALPGPLTYTRCG